MAQRWTFVADLFRELLPAEPPRRQQPREDLRLRRMREYVFTGIAAVCALLCLIFLGSWYGNRELLQRVEAAGASKPAYSKPASLADFQALEKLRGGSGAVAAGRRPLAALGIVYGQPHSGTCADSLFSRFRLLLLDELNAGMTTNLSTVSDSADRYDDIYRTLQTHLIISGNGCGLDPELVSKTLRDQERSQFVDAGPEWRRAAEITSGSTRASWPTAIRCRYHWTRSREARAAVSCQGEGRRRSVSRDSGDRREECRQAAAAGGRGT